MNTPGVGRSKAAKQEKRLKDAIKQAIAQVQEGGTVLTLSETDIKTFAQSLFDSGVRDAENSEQNRHISFEVGVIGCAWQGFEATYLYTFDKFPTEKEITSKAGDFQSITDYQITRITTGGSWEYDWTRRAVVRDWSKPESEEKYWNATARQYES